MKVRILRVWIRLIAGAVALAIAVLVPIGYFANSYTYQADRDSFMADLSAARVAKYIYLHSDLWRYEKERIAEAIDLGPELGQYYFQNIFDASDRLVTSAGQPQEFPWLVRSAPITVANEVVGRVEVVFSLRPVLEHLAFVALFSVLCALVTYGAVRVLPLRALDRAIADLRHANRKIAASNKSLEARNALLRQRDSELTERNIRFDATIENMAHALSMFDRQARLVVCNRRFVEVFALPARLADTRSHLDEIVTHLVKAGIFSDADEAARCLSVPSSAGNEESGECGYHLADGRHLVASSRLMSDGGWVVLHRDVTEEVRRQEALDAAQSSLRLRTNELAEAQRIGRLAAWSMRFGAAKVDLSPDVFELLGYDPATFWASNEDILNILSGAGAKRVMEARAEALRTGQASSVDIKIHRGDGTLGDFAVTAMPFLDGEGRTIGLRGTIQDISERKLAEEQLEKLAYHDTLTGLANRSLFYRNLDDYLAGNRDAPLGGALLVLDLDRFKEVNDTLGHSAGDDLLGKITRVIARLLSNDHFFARLGGDEFAILVPHETDIDAITTLASQVIAAAGEPMRLGRVEVAIGTSIGIALIPQHGSGSTELMRNADLALYQAKEAGRGCFAIFDPTMNEEIQRKTGLARDLRAALASGHGLATHYQPQVDLKTGLVNGFEALARWTHPTLGNIPPSEFIPIAESSQLICDLGYWILRDAALQARAWFDSGEPIRKVSVNVSAAQIWSTDFPSEVSRVLKETGLPPKILCLELTESLFADHEKHRIKTTLDALKRQGISLSLDDFGTGYSSLGYLNQLPFDILKIDRVFVSGIVESTRSRELVSGIIALGRGLGMKVIAEGAELIEEVEILRSLGCDGVQGFVFARPTIAAEALDFAHRCASETPGFLSRAG